MNPELDHYEEGRIKKLQDKKTRNTEKNIVQLALKGMWTDASEGCPHRVGMKHGPDRCGQPGFNMTICAYELHIKEIDGCDIFKGIIREWQEFYHLNLFTPDYYAQKKREQASNRVVR